MKKENRELAKQRREKERKKKQTLHLVKKIVLGVIIAAIVVALVWVSVDTYKESRKEAKAKTTTSSTKSSSSSSTDSTDSSATDTSSTSDSSSSSATSGKTLDKTKGTVVKSGDTVNIDYTGYLNGTAFDGGSTNGAGADLTLGSGIYIDGFESSIEGHSVGESFDINVTFPTDYSSTDLAGKAVTFHVTINGVYK